jgi:hypothetical protein
MQSVSVSENEKVAFDWTFQTIKNYNLPGTKAIFTGNKGSTKEIITLAVKYLTIVQLMLATCGKRSVACNFWASHPII